MKILNINVTLVYYKLYILIIPTTFFHRMSSNLMSKVKIPQKSKYDSGLECYYFQFKSLFLFYIETAS